MTQETKEQQAYDGKPRCPICNSELIWSSNETANEVLEDRPDDDYSCLLFYTCPNCGANLECEECPDEDKHLYPYWEK